MFVDFFIRRPVFATVCALMIILAGAVVIPTLPVAQFPDIVPPQVSLTTLYPGADAQTVEATVAQPIEQQSYTGDFELQSQSIMKRLGKIGGTAYFHNLSMNSLISIRLPSSLPRSPI